MKAGSPWLKWLTEPLRGKTSLARAFWIYGLVGSIVYTFIGLLFPRTPTGIAIYLIVGLIVGILQTVILWRCAPNSRSASLRRLVRTLIIVGLILTPALLYLMLAYPDMLTLDGL